MLRRAERRGKGSDGPVKGSDGNAKGSDGPAWRLGRAEDAGLECRLSDVPVEEGSSSFIDLVNLTSRPRTPAWVISI